jgi:hypothetical protein
LLYASFLEAVMVFMPLEIEYDRPYFDNSRIVPNERDRAWEISRNLYSLIAHAQDFGAAVQLFDFAMASYLEIQNQIPSYKPGTTELRHALRQKLRPSMNIYERWQFIAGRDGAITIYNLGRAMEGIRASLKSCPSYNALINQDALTESTQILRRRFPRFEGVRHTVGHAAEFSQSPEARAKHASTEAMDGTRGMTKPEGTSVYIGRSFNGREFFATFDGKIVSYELSLESFEHAKRAVLKMIEAFRPSAIQPSPTSS